MRQDFDDIPVEKVRNFEKSLKHKFQFPVGWE